MNSEEVKKNISLSIKIVRRFEFQKSQITFGKMLGVSQHAVNNWEVGKSLPKTKTLIKLIELSALSMDEFVGLREIENPNLRELFEEGRNYYGTQKRLQRIQKGRRKPPKIEGELAAEDEKEVD